jgi:predicted dehydrogenase
MRFAFYAGDEHGDEPVGLSVARAAALLPGHALTRVVGRPQLGPGMPPFAPNVRYCRSWEDLLTDVEVDAVIVTGAGDERQEAVRQLVQAGKAVLVSPELVQSPAFFYEMALAEAEAPGRLFPLLGLRGHPLIAKLHELLSQDRLGRLLHVRLDRQLASSAPDSDPLLSDADLARALLRDADILRCLCGDYDQVTASRSGDAERGYSLVTITLAGSSVAQAVWTASTNGSESEWRLTLAGDAGTAVLEGDPVRGELELTVTLRGQSVTAEQSPNDPGPWLLNAFAESTRQADPPDAPAGSNREADDPPVVGHRDDVRAPIGQRSETRGTNSLWSELARAVELVDAVERSIRRRRTIDVYFDTPSERGIFKTQMTAVGCSLLVLTLLAVVVYLGLAAAIVLPPFLKNVLVALIFTPLGVFLILQLLVFVARPATRDSR